MSRRLVFIDSSVSNPAELLRSWQPLVQVEAIPAGKPALLHMEQVLAEGRRQGRAIEVLDIVTHGTPGELCFGAMEGAPSGQPAPADDEGWPRLARHLDPHAQILIYGCETGAGVAGRCFVDDLARATGAAVAAASRRVGQVGSEANWGLDVTSGNVSAQPLSAVSWVGQLAVLTGTSGDDNLSGTSGADTLTGGAGDDTLYGNGGGDDFSGGSGNDWIYGGVGRDIFRFGIGDGQDTVVAGEWSSDEFNMEIRPVDVVKLGPGISESNLSLAVNGQDLVIGVVGSTDRLTVGNFFVGDGAQIGRIEFDDGTWLDPLAIHARLYVTGAIHQTLADKSYYAVGAEGNDTLSGAGTSDTLMGAEGADLLLGMAGNDTLVGGTGDDTLDGGTGSDTLLLGSGANVYRFGRGSGQDTISADNNSWYFGESVSDLDPQRNLVQLGEGLGAADITVRNISTGWEVVILGSSDRLVIQSVNPAQPEAYSVWNLRFADGSVWDLDTLRQQALVGSSGNDSIQGYAGNDRIDGLAGDDTLIGRAGDDTLIGGSGNDSLTGGDGQDSYLLESGFGRDTVVNSDAAQGYDRDGNFGWVGNTDRVQFGAGISPDQVLLGRSGLDLLMAFNGSTDLLRVASWFGSAQARVEELRFADGTVWSPAVISQLLNIPSDGDNPLSGYAAADVLRGAAGADTLSGGAGDDTLDGGAGNDWLAGGNGADTYIFGLGSGQDIIDNRDGDAIGTQKDVLQLGAGITTANVTLTSNGWDLVLAVTGTTDQVTIVRTIGTQPDRPGSDRALIDEIRFADGTVWSIDTQKLTALAGTAGNDSRLEGYAGADSINGLGGDDTISGGTGNDTLDGGAGNDRLNGGTGDDTFWFGIGSGQDSIQNSHLRLSSGTELDTIQLGAGVLPSAVVLAREGEQLVLRLSGGADELRVQSFFDTTLQGSRNWQIRFDDGTIWNRAAIDAAVKVATEAADDLVGGGAADTISALGGDDGLYGGGGADSLLGGAGNDTLEGANGNDTLDGGAGNDSLAGGRGADTYLFGSGSGQDVITEIGKADVDVLQLGAGITAAGVTWVHSGNDLLLSLTGSSDTLRVSGYFNEAGEEGRIEQIRFADGTVLGFDAVRAKVMTGSTGNDLLAGFSSADSLSGLEGNDTLLGAEGGDTLIGGAGNDSLNGGTGGDVYRFDAGWGQDTLSDASGDADVVEFGVGITAAGVTLARSGSALIVAVSGGTDSLTVQNYFSDATTDRLEAFRFSDGTVLDHEAVKAIVFTGTAGNDSIVGASSAESLSGLAGNDTLTGNAGNDTLDGGAGNDSLAGGAGADTYFFAPGFGQDTIYDYEYTYSGAAPVDTVRFGAGIAAADVVVTGPGNGNGSYLWLNIAGTTDRVEIRGFLDNPANRIERFEFSDGTVWSENDVRSAYLAGTSGNDWHVGSEQDDQMSGQAGNDTLAGIEGDDTLDGGTGNDLLNGYLGSDTYRFDLGSGQDTIVDYTGSAADVDSIVFGAGITPDMVTQSQSGNDLLFTLTGTTDTLRVQYQYLSANYGIERAVFSDGTVLALRSLSPDDFAINGTAAANYLYGTNFDEVIRGLGGDDQLFGNGGDDTLDGGAGNDNLDGGSGNDVYLFGVGSGQDVIYVYGRGSDNLQLTMDIAAADVAVARIGSDLVVKLVGSTDQVTISNQFSGFYSALDGIATLRFADGSSWSRAELEARSLLGSPLDDVLTGGSNSEFITGQTGNDTLTGAGGDDTLDGGAGNDSLVGGSGSDVYRFAGGGGQDVISNLDSSTSVDLVEFGAGITPASLVLARSGSNLLVSFGAGSTDQLTLENFYSGAAYVLDGFRFADGTRWSLADIIGRSLLGTAGNDTLTAYLIHASIAGGAGNDTLTGDGGNDTLDGGEGADSLVGAGGDDSLVGGSGIDTMVGGAGDDIYLRDVAGDLVVEELDAGRDIVYSAVNYTLAANVEDLVLTGAATNGGGNALANGLIGNAANNLLAGAAGADTLIGAAGNDTLIGGLGDDTYSVDSAGDVVTELPGEGNDLIRSSITLTLAANVENLHLLGAAAINGAGNALDNLLIGNVAANVLNGADGNDTLNGAQGTDNLFGGNGNDTLDGGRGDDTMTGGGGNDAYLVDSVLDVVSEAAGQGTDTVQTEINLRLGANIENGALAGGPGRILIGNDLANTLSGNSSANDLRGGAGNDLLYGNEGNDTLNGGSGVDTLVGGDGDDTYLWDGTGDVIVEDIRYIPTGSESSGSVNDLVIASVNYTLGANLEHLTLAAGATNGGGNELNNRLTGNDAANVLAGGAGHDTLIGGLGADTLYGGTGNDTFHVDVAGDVVNENAGEGSDTVISEINLTLGAHLENLTLQGAATNAGGNALDNTLIGNANANLLVGAAGQDTLDGGGGNDTLDGGSGDDSMLGGFGDDVFHVDSSGDLAVEASYLGGTDLVMASVNYGIDAYVENLTLTGTANLIGVGNELNNLLTGNSGHNQLRGWQGNDTLDGAAGNDTLEGGSGDDVYHRDTVGDVVVEEANAGEDTVHSAVNYTLVAHVEHLVLTGTATNGGGNALDNHLTGNALANLLAGAAGEDTLDGGSGADTMYGGLGDDVYLVDQVGDIVSEAAGQGEDSVWSSISYSLVDTDGAGASGGNVENLGLAGTANINATGNALNNKIGANNGVNVIDGGAGIDTLYYDLVQQEGLLGVTLNLSVVDGSGYATASGISGADRVIRIENLVGSDGNDNFTGDALANRLEGQWGDDTLNGAGGADTLVGGGGNDVYYRDSTGDLLIEQAWEGLDTVYSYLNYTLGSHLENVTLLGSATNAGGNELANVLIGNALGNLLSGAAGNDTLDGGAGADTLYGRTGDDTYIRDNAADVLNENAGEGTDTVVSSLNYTLGAQLENLTLTGAATNGGGNSLNNHITGNANANLLVGAAGHDTLDGGAGVDSLYGGLGDDSYVRDNAADVIVENAGEGRDTVLSSLNYTLGANLENLTLIGAAANGGGNALDNTLVGNQLDNLLSGAAGNDTIVGGAGNDTLYGGAGSNLMAGDEGDDTYYRDSATDLIVEFYGEGTDRVFSSLDYTLTADVEHLTLTGSAVQGGGNSLANRITGNTLANNLTGGLGNDTLDGATGADTLAGGMGDDTYVRDNTADVVIESANEGTDTVVSSVNYTLAANVENLTLATGATNGGGNALANHLIGNAAANTLAGAAGNDTLDGGAGADALYGGTGDDVYVFDIAGDTAVENLGEGTDTVITSFNLTLGANLENLTLIGAATNGGGNGLDNVLTGNANANLLSGAAGNDTLAGGAANDTLVGGAGNDSFLFDTALNGTTNVDVITDFAAGDRLLLDNDIFTTLTGVGDLSGAEFYRGAGLTGSTEDIQGTGLYYDTTTGSLYYDADGFGGVAGVKFAVLTGAPVLSSAAVVVVD